MVHLLAAFAATATLLAGITTAHPGHDAKLEALQRRAYINGVAPSKRSLSHCSQELKARGHDKRSNMRRQKMAQEYRQKRSLQSKPYLRVRDLDTVLDTDHQSNLTGISPWTPMDVLFTGENSCLLNPEVTQGPYYVEGEYFRSDLVESEVGVPIYLDVQLVDMDTCEPVPNIYLETWHCNATGVYSGIQATTNGNYDDTSNLNKTFLRGIQKTDYEGAVKFETIVPGHYGGRANHIHVLSHTNAHLSANNTLRGTGGTVSHVGQLFFDQSLLTSVEASYPYSLNTIVWTQNANDSILQEEAEGDMDPILEYVLLGDKVEDGLVAWITLVFDQSANYTADVKSGTAAYFGAGGGVMNPDAGPPSGAPAVPDRRVRREEEGWWR
ncbi:putative extracellular dioxygenase [Saccharata proteae CBS 121410]|uniref:Extracellular dioxygenase n=1 Tax=Saccharata proteae CBS 121410 TaxID=1314787 RepID=A0A9P4HV18_9PEZI|nr:putative extracellular dioxygenase [Saccharata proteae CBS 121410]